MAAQAQIRARSILGVGDDESGNRFSGGRFSDSFIGV
jgi:hypothetical protein